MARIFLTGEPGCGKSTVLMKVVDSLKHKGLKVGGFVTPETRKNGKRIGFKVVDIDSNEEGILSSINQKTGHSVGKYRVDISDFERVALKALDFAMKECDVICIDEIGKMELFSEKFREKLKEILSTDKPLVCALHRNLINQYERCGKILYVTHDNRETLQEDVINSLGFQ
jgi:nucleoside-triphosphatase